jgi:hypothetical protein
MRAGLRIVPALDVAAFEYVNVRLVGVHIVVGNDSLYKRRLAGGAKQI